MIERYNVLELLGADKNKYHSCIITCYSFDFLFFEQRVLPKLRHAGIININLFVDAKMFQQQLEALDGNYRNNKSYSITPIDLNGAFHPKIIMTLGKTNGFLAIGSGNLTNSGLSSNDEVWGAFHTYKTESEAAPLFKNVFQYLNSLEDFCYGINKTKWHWILKNTSWLNDILNDNNTTSILKSKEETIQIVSSFVDTSIYKQLLDALPKEPLESLIVISPYFNKKGQIIEQFITDLKPSKVKVVVDSRFGTVPYKFSNDTNVQFYDWENVESITTHQSPRLHAKIIQLKFKTKTCILIGSTNASVEALGTKKRNTKNAEMSILIETNKKKDWLQEMKIELPEKGDFNLDNYLPQKEEYIIDNDKNIAFKIKHAELDYTTLKIYGLNFNNLSNSFRLVVAKKNDLFYKQPLKDFADDEYISIELTEQDVNGAYKIYFEDSIGIRQSNITFLHFYQDIIKTNPDEKSLRFLELINSDTLPDNDLIELLEYARFERPTTVYNANNNSPISIKNTDEDDNKVFNIVDEEEFNKNEEVIGFSSNNNTKHLTLLEAFLDNMTFGSSANEDFADSNERTVENARDLGVDDKDLNNDKTECFSYTEGQKLKKKLHNTLLKIFDVINEKHVFKLEQSLENKLFDIPEILNDIKSVLIGLHLIIMKTNYTFIEEKIQFKIKFKSPKDIIAFEKEKGYNISRIRPQVNVTEFEILYSADVNLLSNIDDLISKHKPLEISYIDETPSIIKQHKYFESNPILKNQKLFCETVKGYLINTVSPLLLLLLNAENNVPKKEYIKYNIYKKRLFYRVVLIYNSVLWTNKEENNCKLFLLNLFEALLPRNASVEEVKEELHDIRYKLNEYIEKNNKSYSIFEYHLSSYLNWKKVYNNEKSNLIEVLDKRHLHKIVFKSKFGFCRIITIYENELNVETPLGYFYDDNESYQIKGIIGGKSAIIYK